MHGRLQGGRLTPAELLQLSGAPQHPGRASFVLGSGAFFSWWRCKSSDALQSPQREAGGCWARGLMTTCPGLPGGGGEALLAGTLLSRADVQRDFSLRLCALGTFHVHTHARARTQTHARSALAAQALRSSLFIMSGGMLPSPVTTVINDNVQT